MTLLTPNALDEVLAACTAGAEEAAESLSRVLEAPLKLNVGSGGPLLSPSNDPSLTGAGLVVVLTIDTAAAVLTVPAASGLVPSWCMQPDPTGQSKLATLAQELGMILLPGAWNLKSYRAAWVNDLTAALDRGGLSADAVRVPLEVTVEGAPRTPMGLIWPVEKPEAVLAAPVAAPAPPPKPKPAPAAPPKAAPKPAAPPTPQLPPYMRSLLRIKVPIVVTLAGKRQPLKRIVELSPGAIIQFDKSCEEMLDLQVGNRRIAAGEAVKVGDKFGLRIVSITPPDERFTPVGGGQKTR